MSDDAIILKHIEEFSITVKSTQAIKFLTDGKYKIADALLLEAISNFGDRPYLLNLYALSLAQQGRFVEAESTWKKALKIQPDNLHFQNAINKIHSLQKKRFGFSYGLNSIAKIIAALLIVLFLLWIGFGNVKLTNQIQDLSKKQSKNSSVSTYSKEFNQPSPVSQMTKIIGDVKNNLTGISILQNESTASITFNEGLFENGNLLNNSAKILLNNLANTLKTYNSQLTIVIYGCTDNIPVARNNKYVDNISLANERAKVVADIFRSNSKDFNENILIGSYSEAQSPFSNNSLSDKNKNKTVVIKISPGQLQ
jgi:outer membrane protein OmpA-like peptidoglycan-associated protein